MFALTHTSKPVALTTPMLNITDSHWSSSVDRQKDPMKSGSLNRASQKQQPSPAILGRTQQEAVCHDLDQKLLPSHRCRDSLV